MTRGPTMRLVTTDGVVAAQIDEPKDRSTIGSHANAVARFLATGDTDALVEFIDVEIAGHRLETDPDELEAWAAQGELEFEDIYDSGR